MVRLIILSIVKEFHSLQLIIAEGRALGAEGPVIVLHREEFLPATDGIKAVVLLQGTQKMLDKAALILVCSRIRMAVSLGDSKCFHPKQSGLLANTRPLTYPVH